MAPQEGGVQGAARTKAESLGAAGPPGGGHGPAPEVLTPRSRPRAGRGEAGLRGTRRGTGSGRAADMALRLSGAPPPTPTPQTSLTDAPPPHVSQDSNHAEAGSWAWPGSPLGSEFSEDHHLRVPFLWAHRAGSGCRTGDHEAPRVTCPVFSPPGLRTDQQQPLPTRQEGLHLRGPGRSRCQRLPTGPGHPRLHQKPLPPQEPPTGCCPPGERP